MTCSGHTAESGSQDLNSGLTTGPTMFSCVMLSMGVRQAFLNWTLSSFVPIALHARTVTVIAVEC